MGILKENNITAYFTQPEFKPILYLLPLLAVLLVGNFFFLSGLWLWISVVALFLLGSILFAVSFRLAKANAEAKAKTLEMASIISHLSSGVIFYDSEFEIILCNPAAQNIFRVREDDIVGKKMSADLVSDPKLKTLIQVIFSSLAPKVVRRSDPGAYPQIADVSFEDPRLELSVITERVFDEKGKLVGFLKLITDKTREQELLSSKTEFIAVAAHQLRTPITAINWAFEGLGGSDLSPQQKELADTGFLAAKKMLKTVNDLLDVSKMEDGRFGYQFEDTELVSFVRDMLSRMRDVSTQYGIKLYFDCSVEKIWVQVDQSKFSMVLSNVLDNAIRYNVENGEVFVSLKSDPVTSRAVIDIRDTGIGIPPHQMDKLFSKFFRAENAAKAVADGSGLGLYIAKNIMEQHGGGITVQSELNRGTVFSISLPEKKPTDTGVLTAE